MGPLIAEHHVMQKVGLARRTFLLFLILGCAQAQPAMVTDSSDPMIVPSSEVDTNGDTPHELFPLSEAPESTAEPLRSEVPTLQTVQEWHDLRAKILNDFGSRISQEFHIQDGLRQRTQFWFDIYTKYGEAHHLVHHVLYPWIIFKVIDTTEILTNSKGPQWLRHEQANKLVRREADQIRAALRRLAKRRDYSNLGPLEKDLYDRLMPVKGSRRQVFQTAANNVRSQLGQRNFFQRGLVNSSRYLPYMEEEFKRRGLPTELTRMPFVESSFNEDARSKVGASGIWQIMPATGKAYMIVNDKIDERNSPLKATSTAGRLLHSYNHALKSWPLTITSYNHGIGNIQKAINRAHSRDLPEIIERYHDGDFKFASSNFYTCFLAAMYAEKYHELIFKETPREPLKEREVLKLSSATPIKYLQKMTGLQSKELLSYNLDLRAAMKSGTSLPRGFQLHLPPGIKDRFLRKVGIQDKKAKART